MWTNFVNLNTVLALVGVEGWKCWAANIAPNANMVDQLSVFRGGQHSEFELSTMGRVLAQLTSSLNTLNMKGKKFKN